MKHLEYQQLAANKWLHPGHAIETGVAAPHSHQFSGYAGRLRVHKHTDTHTHRHINPSKGLI